MIRINPILLFPLFLLHSSCLFESDTSAKFYPIDSTKLLYNKNDVLAFKIDSIHYVAALLNSFSKDEGGTWYRFCFVNYYDTLLPDSSVILMSSFYGRKVQTTLNDAGYYKAFDFTNLHEKCLIENKNKISVISNFPISVLQLGSESVIDTYEEFISDFKHGRKQRLLPPDCYKDHFKEHHRPQEYFSISELLKK